MTNEDADFHTSFALGLDGSRDSHNGVANDNDDDNDDEDDNNEDNEEDENNEDDDEEETTNARSEARYYTLPDGTRRYFTKRKYFMQARRRMGGALLRPTVVRYTNEQREWMIQQITHDATLTAARLTVLFNRRYALVPRAVASIQSQLRDHDMIAQARDHSERADILLAVISVPDPDVDDDDDDNDDDDNDDDNDDEEDEGEEDDD